jgi:hypothetical protein
MVWNGGLGCSWVLVLWGGVWWEDIRITCVKRGGRTEICSYDVEIL